VSLFDPEGVGSVEFILPSHNEIRDTNVKEK
jgi:hypothetical protein